MYFLQQLSILYRDGVLQSDRLLEKVSLFLFLGSLYQLLLLFILLKVLHILPFYLFLQVLDLL